MNTNRVFSLLLLILLCNATAVACIEMNKKVSLTDTSEINKFKEFSDKFFKAIRQKDTTFLKAHIIFPIKNSSFSIFNRSLEGKGVTAQILLKNLPKYFPKDLIEKLPNADYSISQHPNFQTKYLAILYDEEGGVETNYSWIFTKYLSNCHIVMDASIHGFETNSKYQKLIENSTENLRC